MIHCAQFVLLTASVVYLRPLTNSWRLKTKLASLKSHYNWVNVFRMTPLSHKFPFQQRPLSLYPIPMLMTQFLSFRDFTSSKDTNNLIKRSKNTDVDPIFSTNSQILGLIFVNLEYPRVIYEDWMPSYTEAFDPR